MADTVDLRNVVKHLVDGTFDRSLCRICLLPLGEVCENIFTQICREDQGFCIADVLIAIAQIKISPMENCNVCSGCFLMASTAYKFYIMSKRSNEILNFYVEELEKNVNSITQPEDTTNDTLCITLPEYTPTVKNFSYNLNCCLSNKYLFEQEDNCAENLLSYIIKQEMVESKLKTEPKINNSILNKNKEEEMVIVIDQNGQHSYYKLTDEGTLELATNLKKVQNVESEKIPVTSSEKSRRKRSPMAYTKCSRCPVKYRFLGKLQSHMKTVHGIDLFVCKICKAVIEDKKEIESHLSSHTGIHRCDYCNTVFKKRETIINHLKWHEEMKNMPYMDTAHVCELCGYILPNEEQLKDHYDKKHEKKFTCFYCGKMYKGESSWTSHIKKHEMHIAKEKKPLISAQETETPEKAGSTKRRMCSICGKHFVDERSLMWHSRLHTNERPYTCDTCGRGFISVNRRNQHVLCAHTMPTKRCPLCPALFHLRSMVNSHIKKVHLKAHKRRNRTSKHQTMNVHWRTEPVPLEELGVDIQDEILDLQTRRGGVGDLPLH